MCWHVPIGAHTCALRTICCFQFTCGPEHAAQRPAPRPPAQPPRAISVRRPTPARALGRTRRRRLSRRRRPHPPTRLSYGELANSCLTNSLNCGTCGPSARAAWRQPGGQQIRGRAMRVAAGRARAGRRPRRAAPESGES